MKHENKAVREVEEQVAEREREEEARELASSLMRDLTEEESGWIILILLRTYLLQLDGKS